MSLIVKKKGISKVPEFIDVKWANVTSIFALIFVFGKSVLIPKKILGSFFIAIVVAIGSLAMVPYYYSYGATINLSLFLISSFIYGSIFYSFRRSTLFENIQETNLSKIAIYFSIFVVMFIFTAIVYLFIISFFIIGLAVDSKLFIDDWFFRDHGFGSGGYLITELSAQLMVWWFIAFICLNFSLFYLFQNIVNSQKNFYLFVFLYLILLLIYGNALNTPYTHDLFIIIEEHSFLNSSSENNIYLYIGGIYLTDIFLIPNQNFPFDVSFYLGVSDLLKPKFENGNYFSAFMILLTPHYWINIYSANVMKATCLSAGNFNLYTINNDNIFWGNYPIIEGKINNFGKHEYVFSRYTFTNAKIWSLKNEIGWILGMYLWMAYFILFYFVGRCISKLKYYKS